MDAITSPCQAHSVGASNQLFGLLIQTILASQCAISPPDMWPKDHGPEAIEKGKYFLLTYQKLIFIFSLNKC